MLNTEEEHQARMRVMREVISEYGRNVPHLLCPSPDSVVNDPDADAFNLYREYMIATGNGKTERVNELFLFAAVALFSGSGSRAQNVAFASVLAAMLHDESGSTWTYQKCAQVTLDLLSAVARSSVLSLSHFDELFVGVAVMMRRNHKIEERSFRVCQPHGIQVVCTKCGMSMQYTPQPNPNEIICGGEAVAGNCQRP